MRIKAQDILIFDRLFDSAGGYLLDFSNRTLAEFFDEELNIDIEDDLYKIQGDSNSKAKRVRRLLEKSDQATVLRVLDSLWSYKQQTAPAAAQRDQADYFPCWNGSGQQTEARPAVAVLFRRTPASAIVPSRLS